MLLNLAIFMWFGAVCPWSSFAHNNIIPIYRLIFLGILILLVRRVPIVFAMHKYIRQIENKFQASFVGFFGPIGVGAAFYLSVSREFLFEITVDGKVREDAQQVAEAIDIIVWFLIICSIVCCPYFPYLYMLIANFTTCRLSMASRYLWSRLGLISPVPFPVRLAMLLLQKRNRSPSPTYITLVVRQHRLQSHPRVVKGDVIHLSLGFSKSVGL